MAQFGLGYLILLNAKVCAIIARSPYESRSAGRLILLKVVNCHKVTVL